MLQDFWDVHSDLPREGPGSFADTARALELAKPLPKQPRVLDLACGPGQQALDLLKLMPDARITAVDTHTPFLDQLRARTDRVQPLQGDMAAPPVASGCWDLVWCEGAAYLLGVERALEIWRPLLAPGGRVALSEPVWLTDDRPPSLEEFWQEYPAMRSVAELRGVVARSDYQLLGDFVLDESSWWDYYRPLEEKVRTMAGPAADETRREIDVYRRYSEHYGYAFLVMGVEL